MFNYGEEVIVIDDNSNTVTEGTITKVRADFGLYEVKSRNNRTNLYREEWIRRKEN